MATMEMINKDTVADAIISDAAANAMKALFANEVDISDEVFTGFEADLKLEALVARHTGRVIHIRLTVKES